MRKNHYQKTKYLLNAPSGRFLPEDSGIEVVFAGRSNAGKSSVLNTLVRQKGLARTSKTPGRTQELVCFEIDEKRRLIDLPGYGFAKVPEAKKLAWAKSLDEYFQTRQSLRGLVLIMDVRHPMKPDDEQMLQWCQYQKLPVRIILNKADKLSRGAASSQLQMIRNMLTENESVQLFSALKKTGVEELIEQLDNWFESESEE